jgi:Effector Associated Constant Component 1
MDGSRTLVRVESVDGEPLAASELERDVRELYDRLRTVLPAVDLERETAPPDSMGLPEIQWTAIALFLAEPALGVFLQEVWDWLQGRRNRRLRLVIDGVEIELDNATQGDVDQAFNLARRRIERRLRG